MCIAILGMIGSIYGLIATIKYFFLDSPVYSVGWVIGGSCLISISIVVSIASGAGLAYCIQRLEQSDRESTSDKGPDSFVIAMNRDILDREKETLLTAP